MAGETQDMEVDVVGSIMDTVNEIAGIGGECRSIFKKECANLTRRIKLLTPMFEELKEMKGPLPQETTEALQSLQEALKTARELVKFGHDGSKLYLVLEREQVASKFRDVTTQLEQALNGLSYENLDLSDEVQEQVELVHAQFKRAKGRPDTPDSELFEDLSIVLSQRSDKNVDQDVLRRLAEKLQLKTISDLKQESLALHTMVMESGGDAGERLEQMSGILKRLKDFVLTENPDIDASDNEKGSYTCSALTEKSSSPVIPDDFRCPISLELMKDPVIVATGQTYERVCIQKWLDSGHRTCPKTQQTLPHIVLTPNYVLRSLIAQWCESNGIELPKRSSSSRCGKSGGSTLDNSGDRATIDVLLQKLSNGTLEEQRAAAGELRLLAKRNADNRICIAEAGAIPLLVNLLSTPDARTQEHAVTALLNLSIYENNKGAIVMAGAIAPIVEVLKNGSMEARENAAATLFSLSVVDENKITIGASGAIPALVGLLCEGSQRGKKDAATALFNLSIYQGNKARAVRAGVVAPLMQLLVDPSAGMVDEALAILAILASHQEGKIAIGNADAIPILVDIIRTGSPRNRENSSAVLLALCTNDPQNLIVARDLGAYEPLSDLVQNGTARAKRKAASLLEHMNKPEQPPSS
uniref:RING-type E3 ubiquitin transferase n=1 Tax=Araucaria cunninghamii TaxID=56994 RepID=A0A0D6QYP5_ARACU